MPTPVRRARPRLGELLVELGALEPSQLEAVLEQQRQWGMSFGRAAIACGYCTEFEILAALTPRTGGDDADVAAAGDEELFDLLDDELQTP